MADGAYVHRLLRGLGRPSSDGRPAAVFRGRGANKAFPLQSLRCAVMGVFGKAPAACGSMRRNPIRGLLAPVLRRIVARQHELRHDRANSPVFLLAGKRRLSSKRPPSCFRHGSVRCVFLAGRRVRRRYARGASRAYYSSGRDHGSRHFMVDGARGRFLEGAAIASGGALFACRPSAAVSFCRVLPFERHVLFMALRPVLHHGGRPCRPGAQIVAKAVVFPGFGRRLRSHGPYEKIRNIRCGGNACGVGALCSENAVERASLECAGSSRRPCGVSGHAAGGFGAWRYSGRETGGVVGPHAADGAFVHLACRQHDRGRDQCHRRFAGMRYAGRAL